jgi:3-hydroxybutyryl-CoA dehydrogenase
VEVVAGGHTDAAAVQVTLDLLTAIGKTAVHIRKEVPGFLVNRIQVAMLREILDLLEKGVAPAEDIDRAFRASVGFRSAVVGPLQVFDFAGIDVASRCYSELVQDMRSDREVHDVIKRLVAQGNLGTKTGRGIYEYTPESVEEKMAARDAGYLAIKKLLH